MSYFLLSGGEFAPGLREPFAKMMTNYLIEKQKQALIIENSSLEGDDLLTELDKFQKIIFEERHSKTTSDNIILGHHLLNLLSQEETRKRRDLPELEGLPIYYVSSGYHLNRIKNVLEAHGFNKHNDVFVSSGRDKLSDDPKRAVKEYAHRLIVLVDPKGDKLPFEKCLRRTRTHPISYYEDAPK